MVDLAWTLPEPDAYGGRFDAELREMLADPIVKEVREEHKAMLEEEEYLDEEIVFPTQAQRGGAGREPPGTQEGGDERGTTEGPGVSPMILCLAAAGLLAAVVVLAFLARRWRKRRSAPARHASRE